MEDFLQNSFVDVVNMSITASYVIIFVLLARLCLKKAPRIFSYSLWAIVLFRLVCPFSFSSAFSLLHMAGANSGKIEYIPSNIAMMAQPQINTGINSVNSAVNASLPAATPFASANPMQIILFVLAAIWAAGIAVLLLYSIIAYLRLKHRVRTAMLVKDNIFESENISSPFVLGIIRPKIYLPTGLNDRQRIHILKHEETHIRRRDYLLKPIAFLALCVHWFNPLVWISFVLMTKDMEMSCDERVLKELGTGIKKDYSTSLLSLATNRRMINAGPLAFGESNVKARIKNVLNYRQPVFWIVVAAAIAVICVGVGLISNPQTASTGENDPVQIPAATATASVPPEIEITAAGTNIIYVVGLNQWNNAIYDREDTFQTIMKGKAKTDLPYIKLDQVFQISFKGTAPDSVKLEDNILQTNGNVRYSERETQTIPIEFKNGKGSFVLAANPAAFLSSASSDYQPGESIRGFRLTCQWGKNECEYAFIIRSDAGHL